MYELKRVFIKTKTNLHVGNGAVNYDIVDKTVQRDSISNLPIINSSSLKGALRDYAEPFAKGDHNLQQDSFKKLFGDDTQGLVRFLDSYLLFLPLRSNTKPFYHATSKDNLLAAVNFYQELGYNIEEKVLNEIRKLNDNVVLNSQISIIEDVECIPQSDIDVDLLLSFIPNLLRPKNIAILSCENFNDVVKHLPVMARNSLDDGGKSKNLWYEEFVPRESIFYTAMLDYDNFGSSSQVNYKGAYNAFFSLLEENYIQVGANASIGFGMCKFVVGEE